jgi:hypothetical protein
MLKLVEIISCWPNLAKYNLYFTRNLSEFVNCVLISYESNWFITCHLNLIKLQICIWFILHNRRDGVVCIATGYGLDDRGFRV